MPALCLSFDFHIKLAEVEYRMMAIGPVLTVLEGRWVELPPCAVLLGPLVFVDEMASNVF
jgi:hypothetical protein